MQFGKYQQRMEYLIELIRKERTGSPRKLAAMLGVSERMVYRYLEELAIGQGKICYCRKKKSYKFRSLT
jgi:predicted DNA-binding transcriptional regulator YafY